MVMIFSLLGSGFECNCYIVSGKKAAVIDAGDPRRLLAKIKELSIGIDYLITTHSHYDHVLGLAELRLKTGAKILVHEADAGALEGGDSSRTASYLFSDKSPKICVDLKLKGGEILDLGGLSLEAIHTPGHTPGGICLYEPVSKSLFSGDTVFADGVGRTDFPGGSMDDLKTSVEKLIKLNNERGIETIYPGHGPPTTGGDLERIYEENF